MIPISPELGDAARAMVAKLKAAGLRVGFDEELREDYRERIKTASQMKVPYMAILGKREAESGTVTLRARGAEKAQETMSGGCHGGEAAERSGGTDGVRLAGTARRSATARPTARPTARRCCPVAAPTSFLGAPAPLARFVLSPSEIEMSDPARTPVIVSAVRTPIGSSSAASRR